MANYVAVTVSDYDVCIPDEQHEALQQVLSRYAFPSELTVGIEGGCLVAYGYEPFQVYLAEDEEMETDVLDEFLEALCPFIPEGRVWKVAQVGYEKCLYVTGWVAKVSRQGVVQEHLDAP